MPFTTAFVVASTVGAGAIAWRWWRGSPRREERIVVQVQQAFRAAGLGIQGADWDVVRVTRITSGKRGEDGLLQGWKLTLRYPEGVNLYDVQGKLDKISEWFGARLKAQGIGRYLYLSVLDPRAAIVVPFDRQLLDRRAIQPRRPARPVKAAVVVLSRQQSTTIGSPNHSHVIRWDEWIV